MQELEQLVFFKLILYFYLLVKGKEGRGLPNEGIAKRGSTVCYIVSTNIILSNIQDNIQIL